MDTTRASGNGYVRVAKFTFIMNNITGAVSVDSNASWKTLSRKCLMRLRFRSQTLTSVKCLIKTLPAWNSEGHSTNRKARSRYRSFNYAMSMRCVLVIRLTLGLRPVMTTRQAAALFSINTIVILLSNIASHKLKSGKACFAIP